MSNWFKEFYVLVKAPVRSSSRNMVCVVKMQEALTREKAQELVANYGAYHRKKRGFCSEENFSVIKNPAKFHIGYTYSQSKDNQSLRDKLHSALEATKSIVLERVWFDGADERNNDIYKICICLTGDASMKHLIESQLRFYQKEDVIIDYSMQVEQYEGADIVDHYMVFKSFNNEFFA